MKPLVMGFSFLGFFGLLLESCECWCNSDPTLLERFKLSLVFFHICAPNETKPYFDDKSHIAHNQQYVMQGHGIRSSKNVGPLPHAGHAFWLP
jgi:hypothetical protein